MQKKKKKLFLFFLLKSSVPESLFLQSFQPVLNLLMPGQPKSAPAVGIPFPFSLLHFVHSEVTCLW